MTLEVKALNKTFAGTGKQVAGIFDVNFHLAPGSFFTLLGPSGCGKTTTLRCVAGLQEPTSGFVGVGDRPFFDSDRNISVPLNKRGIGMVFQSYAIWPHMTVGENVSFPLRVGSASKLSRADMAAKVERALSAVDLGGYADRPATRLSGGQQQRVALARAIVAEPKLLLLDEPLSNLDAALRETMRTELKRLQRQLGITTVYVTHDQTEALEMSDEIAVMQGGRIVQKGPPQDIYFRPANRFVATFIGTTNLVAGVVNERTAAGTIGPVTLNGGQPLRCQFLEAHDAGDKVDISIRPETITVATVNGAMPNSANVLTGTVSESAFLGTSFRYAVREGSLTLTAHGEAACPRMIGDSVALTFEPSGAVVVGASQQAA